MDLRSRQHERHARPVSSRGKRDRVKKEQRKELTTSVLAAAVAIVDVGVHHPAVADVVLVMIPTPVATGMEPLPANPAELDKSPTSIRCFFNLSMQTVRAGPSSRLFRVRCRDPTFSCVSYKRRRCRKFPGAHRGFSRYPPRPLQPWTTSRGRPQLRFRQLRGYRVVNWNEPTSRQFDSLIQIDHERCVCVCVCVCFCLCFFFNLESPA